MRKNGNHSADPKGIESTDAELLDKIKTDKIKVRDERIVEVAARLFLRQRARDSGVISNMEVETQVGSGGNTGEEPACSWERMPKVSKDFHADVPWKASHPEDDDTSGSLDSDGVPVF